MSIIRLLSDTVLLCSESSYRAPGVHCICLRWQWWLYVLQLVVNTVTVKISVGFLGFRAVQTNCKKWEDSLWILIPTAKRNRLIETNAIAIVNKLSLCTNTVSFEKELVLLNGHIVVS